MDTLLRWPANCDKSENVFPSLIRRMMCRMDCLSDTLWIYNFDTIFPSSIFSAHRLRTICFLHFYEKEEKQLRMVLDHLCTLCNLRKCVQTPPAKTCCVCVCARGQALACLNRMSPFDVLIDVKNTWQSSFGIGLRKTARQRRCRLES